METAHCQEQLIDLARLNQAAKLPLFLFDEGSRHRVRGTEDGYEYEYIVIACTK